MIPWLEWTRTRAEAAEGSRSLESGGASERTLMVFAGGSERARAWARGAGGHRGKWAESELERQVTGGVFRPLGMVL